jgi:hypothetical protein
MPVLADIKVIPEHLSVTCRKLQESFRRLYYDTASEVTK